MRAGARGLGTGPKKGELEWNYGLGWRPIRTKSEWNNAWSTGRLIALQVFRQMGHVESCSLWPVLCLSQFHRLDEDDEAEDELQTHRQPSKECFW